MQCSTLPQDVGADSTIQNKEGMTAVDVAPISVLHVFKEDVAKVPPLEEQQQEQQQQTSAGEEPPATRQIKLKLREEQAEYIGDKARKATNTDRGAISTTQNSNSSSSSSSSSANNSNGLSNGLSKGNASESEPSFSFIKRALSPKPSPRPDAEEPAPEGPKQIPESMDIDPAAPSVISEEKANKSFKGKVPEKPAPILEKLLEKPGGSALAPPPKQQQQPRPSGSGGGASLSRAATILEMSKAAKSSKSAQSPAVVAAGVQATASADSAAEQSTATARKARTRLRFHRLCLFHTFILPSVPDQICAVSFAKKSCANAAWFPAMQPLARLHEMNSNKFIMEVLAGNPNRARHHHAALHR